MSWRRKPVWLLKPRNLDICDIALALSKECRYNGRCRGFYSVGEHACHCFDVGRVLNVGPRGLRKLLLHDAPEAFLRDMISPAKLLLPDYKRLELGVQHAIYNHFRCGLVTPGAFDMVHFVDLIVLKAEQCVARNDMSTWNLGTIPTATIKIGRWCPRRTRKEFLRRYRMTCPPGPINYLYPERPPAEPRPWSWKDAPDPTEQISFL